ncbi:MAG: hypothetical protein LEGION0403_FIIPPAGN_02690 [Legionella sp.]|uniref:hypothetical protein n=1 Tax=Legionella sp. TaxID=459 RepID=UPI003D0E3501
MFRKNESMQGKERLLKELEANNPTTIHATFDTYPMFSEDVDRLLDIIRNNTHMVTLGLLDCRITREEAKALAEVILKNNTLQEVKLEAFMDDSLELQTLLSEVRAHLEINVANRNVATVPSCN